MGGIGYKKGDSVVFFVNQTIFFQNAHVPPFNPCAHAQSQKIWSGS